MPEFLPKKGPLKPKTNQPRNNHTMKNTKHIIAGLAAFRAQPEAAEDKAQILAFLAREIDARPVT